MTTCSRETSRHGPHATITLAMLLRSERWNRLLACAIAHPANQQRKRCQEEAGRQGRRLHETVNLLAPYLWVVRASVELRYNAAHVCVLPFCPTPHAVKPHWFCSHGHFAAMLFQTNFASISKYFEFCFLLWESDDSLASYWLRVTLVICLFAPLFSPKPHGEPRLNLSK